MSESTDKLNNTTTAKKHGFVFLDINEHAVIAKSMYSWVYVLGISVSYFLLAIKVIPLLFSGAISVGMYCTIHFGLAGIWLGVGYLMKKYLLQDRLVAKGKNVGNCCA